MKTTFKNNLLHHLIAKKEEGGFTLIELLVVIIIIGILAAIALPSFLNQANKARQSEAKTYVGSMNRAQQAFYLENNSFSGALGSLGLGIPEVTENYKYEAALATIGTLSTALSRSTTWNATTNAANPTAATRAYVGGVSLSKVSTGTAADGTTATDTTTIAILCEANSSPVNEGPTGAAGTIATKTVVIQVDDGAGGTEDADVLQPACAEGWSGV